MLLLVVVRKQQKRGGGSGGGGGKTIEMWRWWWYMVYSRSCVEVKGECGANVGSICSVRNVEVKEEGKQ